MPARTSRDSVPAHRTWRLWALSVVLGVVGMHGLALGLGGGEQLVESEASAAHHAVKGVAGTPTASSAPHQPELGEHLPAKAPAPTPVTEHHGGDGDAGTALCVALLLAFAAAASARRREAWVTVLARATPDRLVGQAPIILPRTPLTRFTVMRC